MTEPAGLASMARGMLEAWNRGDVEGVASTYADDGIMRIAGYNSISGTFRGRAAFLEQLGRIGRTGVVRIAEIESVLASEDQVVVFVRAGFADLALFQDHDLIGAADG